MQQVKWKLMTLLLVGLLLVAFVSGCSSSKQQPQQKAPEKSSEQTKAPVEAPKPKDEPKPKEEPKPPVKITIAIPAPSTSMLPFMVAKQKGFFEKEGLDAEVAVMAANVIVSAMTTGDVGYSGALGSTIRSALKGLPVRVLMGITVRPTHALAVKQAIDTPQKIKGMKIGSSAPGSTDEVITLMLMQSLGLDKDKDVQVLPMGRPPERAAALMAGAIDGTMIEPPDLFKLEAEGSRVLLWLKDYVDMPISGLTASEALIQKDPEQVKKVMRALLKAMQYMHADRAGTIEVISQWLKVDATVAAKSYDGVGANVWTTTGEFTEKGLQNELELDKTVTQVTGDIKMDTIFNYKLLEEVQKELGIKK